MADVVRRVEPWMVEVTTPVPDLEGASFIVEADKHPVPATAPPGARELEHAVYGAGGPGGRDLEVEFYARADVTERRIGIVLVHGGAWIDGGPEQYAHHAYELAARGFVTAAIRYRLAREACWPACLEDVKCSIRWMRASATTLGVDPDRIVVMGGSAGGHLAAMAALTTPGPFEGSGGNGEVSSAVQAAVLSCPPMGVGGVGGLFGDDVANQFYALFFGAAPDEDMLATASPLTYVTPNAPPILVLYGDVDPITPVETMNAFGDALGAVGVPSEVVRWRGRNHGFEGAEADFHELIERVTDFLHRHLGA